MSITRTLIRVRCAGPAGMLHALDISGGAYWPAARDHALCDLEYGARPGDAAPSRETRLRRLGMSHGDIDVYDYADEIATCETRAA